MKANELRIGNLFKDKHSRKVIKVIMLSEDNITFDGCFYGKWQAEPIPLTEEILLNCGFTKHESLIIDSYNMKLTNLIGFKELSVTIQQGNQYIYFKEHDKEGDKKPTDLICLRNFDSHGVFMLHQLQNLYFTLTGKELEINL